ncbi:MAG: hypothetical protein ACYS0H_15125 [Planctomycetota bacterium]
MTSRRKEIEREIAKTTDPVIRAQLQNLLDKKGQRHERMIGRVEEALGSWTRDELARMPARAWLVLILIVIAVLMLIVFLILESGV